MQLFILGLLVLFIAALAFTGYYGAFKKPLLTLDPYEFEINTGDTPLKIAYTLSQFPESIDLPYRHLNMAMFRLFYRGKALQAGVYWLYPHETLYDWLRKFREGRPKEFSITLPEGVSLKEIATLLEDKGVIESAQTFLELSRDTEILKTYNLPAPSIEGYFFPSTYHFPRAYGAKNVIRKALETFKTTLNKDFFDVRHDYLSSIHDYVILASIIEKETGVEEERALISGVFHNRLKKRMRLESDPTTIYGIDNFNGNLTRADLRARTPYNTYMIQGLPQGPICNPGIESLQSAFYPAEHTYIYFVSKNDGTHVFSKTYKEHQKNVEKYQIRR